MSDPDGLGAPVSCMVSANEVYVSPHTSSVSLRLAFNQSDLAFSLIAKVDIEESLAAPRIEDTKIVALQAIFSISLT